MATWNLERKKPHAPRGRAGIDHLFAQDPDVQVVTETWSSFRRHHGHVVCSQPLPHGQAHEDERRVVMWSARPWTDVDDIGHPDLPVGRFVAGTTATPIGDVRVIGICIPWHMSNVSVGTKDKRPWEDHLDYLVLLHDIVRQCDEPLIVAGDFNRRIPRVRGRRAGADALERCFDGLTIHTAGVVEGSEEPLIDHVATSRDIGAERVWAWSNAPDGLRITDHEGVAAELGVGGD